MPLRIVRNDITKMACDAIVNAANPALAGGGGVDGAIHRAAGPKLDEACRKLGGCETGKAKLTPGFSLPSRWIIHTVGPVWQGGGCGEAELLRSCYLESLALAEAQGCESVAFPLISAGAYGFPKELALQIATKAIKDYLQTQELAVWLVIFDRGVSLLSDSLQRDIEQFMDNARAAVFQDRQREPLPCAMLPPCGAAAPAAVRPHAKPRREKRPSIAQAQADAAAWNESAELPELLSQLDESFSQMVLRKIDEKGVKDSVCYKRANIDRKLFSKIRGDVCYRPSKPTVLALAIALELPLEQTRELLQKAGFALSHSSKFDLIVEYFIRRGNYDIFQINEALFAFDQPLLGG